MPTAQVRLTRARGLHATRSSIRRSDSDMSSLSERRMLQRIARRFFFSRWHRAHTYHHLNFHGHMWAVFASASVLYKLPLRQSPGLAWPRAALLVPRCAGANFQLKAAALSRETRNGDSLSQGRWAQSRWSRCCSLGTEEHWHCQSSLKAESRGDSDEPAQES
jgi:hypothetical protein